MKPKFRNITQFYFLFVLTLFLFTNRSLSAQILEENAENAEIVEINVNQLKSNLLNAPVEFSQEAVTQQTLIKLPLPGGVQQTFSAQESPVMDEKLALKYPEIKSYILKGLDDKNISGRMNITPNGASYIIFKDGQMVLLENEFENGVIQHKVFYGSADHRNLSCGTVSEGRLNIKDKAAPRLNTLSNGATLRTYRTAIATTGEFTVANGNSTAGVNAAITTHLNNLNALFEKELAIRFVLIAANDDLIFFNAATDGLDPDGNNGFNRTSSAQTVISGTIPSGDYDIGHVLHTIDINGPPCNGNNGCYSTSGLAGLGVVCNNSRKAEGWTGATSTAPADFFLGTFAHEIAHQFNAEHTFYGTDGNCFGSNRSVGNGYEPGSGNSLMSYEGNCSSHNIEPDVNTHYFHTRSLTQILDYVNSSGSCHTSTNTGNTPPQVTVPNNVTIPKGTPFTLTGSATDADGDDLKYIWEQYDTDNVTLSFPNGAPNDAATSTTAPLFRSFDPSSEGNIRHFPQLSDILNNTQTQGEILPQVVRDMNFRLTARDEKNNGGGIDCGLVTITVENTGPFALTSQNSNTTWLANGTNMATITWSVNGTNTNCPNIDILLSTDGGTTFPITLASDVTNDGSHMITIPNVTTTTGRIKIKCSDNIFFDINNANVEITSSCNAQTFSFSGSGDLTADAGDMALNLTLNPVYGTTLSSQTLTTTNASPTTALALKNSGNTCSNNYGQTNPYEVIEFYAPTTGSYTFSQSNVNIDASVINLYNDPFDENSSCSNWLACSENASAISGSKPISNVNLIGGNQYTLVLSAVNFGGGIIGSSTISFTPSVAEGGPADPGSSYTYTYMAVNSSGVITAISSSSDFTSLTEGTYTIYGVNLITSDVANFNSYIGTNISAIYSGAVCLSLSPNTITLTINAAPICPNTLNVTAVAHNQTYEAANTLTSSIVIPSTNTVIFNAGQSITLGIGFQTAPTSTHTFTAAISSCAPFQAPAVARNNVSHPSEQTDLSLSPNPASEFVTIDYQLGQESMTRIALYDMTGKRLTDIVPMQSQAKGKYQQQFNLGNMQTGMYFILLQTETEQISKKLILVR